MTVRAIYVNDKVYQGRPANFNELQSATLLTEGVLYNCSARIEKDAVGVWHPKGNVTE
jgi:hypothetical protein